MYLMTCCWHILAASIFITWFYTFIITSYCLTLSSSISNSDSKSASTNILSLATPMFKHVFLDSVLSYTQLLLTFSFEWTISKAKNARSIVRREWIIAFFSIKQSEVNLLIVIRVTHINDQWCYTSLVVLCL